jgi:fumarate hydratase class II
VRHAAATVNEQLGQLDGRRAEAIRVAAREVIEAGAYTRSHIRST